MNWDCPGFQCGQETPDVQPAPCRCRLLVDAADVDRSVEDEMDMGQNGRPMAYGTADDIYIYIVYTYIIYTYIVYI